MSNMLELICWVVIGHFIGDFALQSEFLAKNKSKNWYILIAHSLIYTGCVYLPIRILDGVFALNIFLFLLLTHIIIDKFKCVIIAHLFPEYYEGQEVPKEIVQLVYWDQFFHFLCIYLALIILR